MGCILAQLLRRRGAISPPTAPAFLTDPAIVGTPQVGVASSFTPGTYSGTSPVDASTRFRVAGVDVGAADDLTYTPVTDDATKALSVLVSLTNSVGSVSKASADATIIAADEPAPPPPPPPPPPPAPPEDVGVLGDTAAVNDSETFAGATYFVDPVAGDDTYTGLAAAFSSGTTGPWATREPVNAKMQNSASAAAGSAFLFKRGTTLDDAWMAVQSFASGGYMFGTFGTTTDARPILKYAQSTKTTLLSTKPALPRIENMELDGGGLYNSSGARVYGIFPFGGADIASVIHKNLYVHDFTGPGIEISGGSGALVENCLIEGCQAGGSNGAGLDGDCGDGVHIKNVTARNNGVAGASTNHQAYLHNLVNGLVESMLLESTSNLGNHALIIHGVCRDSEVRDVVMRGTYNGLGSNSGYGSVAVPNAETFDRMVYRRFRVSGLSAYRSDKQGNVGLISGHRDSLIELFVAWDFPGRAINWYEGDPATGVYVDDTVNERSVEQHCCYVGDSTAFSGAGGFGGTPASSAMLDMTFRNNIWTSLKSSGTLFVKPAAVPNSEVTVQNCCFWRYGSASASDKVISWDGTTYSVAEMEAYAAANPELGITFEGCIQADPKLVFDDTDTDQPIGIAADSPCLNAGVASGITTDINGADYDADTPSIGPWAAAVA